MEQNPIRLISATQAGMFIGCSPPTFRRLALDNPDSLRPVVTPSGLAWQVEDVIAWCDHIRSEEDNRREALLDVWGCGSKKKDVEIRPVVLWFSGLMEELLLANDDKGGWNDCTVAWLLGRLKEETSELDGALGDGNIEEIPHETADVANFAMMIADVIRRANAKQI